MAEPAKIMAIGDQTTPNQAETTPETGQNQLPGESALWFRRYLIYRDLGHKRSLRAAVSKERETLHMVKAATKSARKQKTDAEPSGKSAAVSEVPGSWKNASKVYRWSERAKAFDVWLLRRAQERTWEHLGDTFANKYKRVQVLDSLINNVAYQINHAMEQQYKLETYMGLVKRLAALLAQMEREMAHVTEDEMKAAIMAYERTHQDEIEESYRGAAALIKKAGGIDQALHTIEAEDRRRKQRQPLQRVR